MVLVVALSQRCWRWSRRRVFDFAGNVGVGLLGFVFEGVAEAVGLGGRAEQNPRAVQVECRREQGTLRPPGGRG